MKWRWKNWTGPQCSSPSRSPPQEPWALRVLQDCPSCPACFQWPDLPFYLCVSEVELPLKKDGFTSESTTLEALLRGEGVEKKVDAREEESIQEIQVSLHLLGTPQRVPVSMELPELQHWLGSGSSHQGPGLSLRLPRFYSGQEAPKFFSDLTYLLKESFIAFTSDPLPLFYLFKVNLLSLVNTGTVQGPRDTGWTKQSESLSPWNQESFI